CTAGREDAQRTRWLVVTAPHVGGVGRRNHRSRGNEQWYTLERRGRQDSRTRAVVPAGPEVDPAGWPFRKINSAFALTELDDRRDEQSRSQHEVIAVIERAGVVGELMEQRSQHRFAKMRGTPIQRVHVR